MNYHKKTVIIRITGQDYKQMLKFPKSPLPQSRSPHLGAIFSRTILLHVETTTITHIFKFIESEFIILFVTRVSFICAPETENDVEETGTKLLKLILY